MKLNQILLLPVFAMSIALTQDCNAGNDLDLLASYCVSKGGTITPMTAWFDTNQGMIEGVTEQFCTFERDNGYLVIGLMAFASDKATIAATYMKLLPEIQAGSALLGNTHSNHRSLNLPNPSFAVCQKLGGTSINYKFHGSFKPVNGGQADVCTFGDGSMVSGWTLIYMANHRPGYDEVKQNVRAQPLPLPARD